MRLMVQVGIGCADHMDREMRELSCERIQVDEIWSCVQKKQARLTPQDDRRRVGDMWTFAALVIKRTKAVRALQFRAPSSGDSVTSEMTAGVVNWLWSLD